MRLQDFDAKGLAHEHAEPRTTALDVSELIARYPVLSPVELNHAIKQYRQLSALDMALMLSDQALAAKLDQFYKDNRRKLRTPFSQYAALLCIAVGGIIFAAWAATMGMM